VTSEKTARTTDVVVVGERAASLSDGAQRSDLPAAGAVLPERKYFRIGEVAEIVGVEPHVLRYWETQFSQLRPHKARSGHRLYRRREVETLLVIKDLLHVQRFTIAGARQALRQGATSSLPRMAEQLTLPPAPAVTARHARVLESTLPAVAEDEDEFDGADDIDDADDLDGVDDGSSEGAGEDELELHLAGPLPMRTDETAIVVEARDGDDLAAAMAAQLAGDEDVVALDVRAMPALATTRRARNLLRQAARDLEVLLEGLRRT
jgi:DNA-binding transcriptional MerR regulator